MRCGVGALQVNGQRVRVKEDGGGYEDEMTAVMRECRRGLSPAEPLVGRGLALDSALLAVSWRGLCRGRWKQRKRAAGSRIA